MMSLKDNLQIANTLEHRARDIKNEAFDIRYCVAQKLAEKHGVESVEFGGWECADSEIDICYYDIDNDPCCDHCLICGGPSERK